MIGNDLIELCFVNKILQGKDLSSVTDKLWKAFYEKRFGNTNTDEVIDKMRSNNLPFKWKQAYEVMNHCAELWTLFCSMYLTQIYLYIH